MECRVCLLLLYLTLVAGNPCRDRALGSQPYPLDCRAYITCWMTVPYLNTCPDDQLYDVQTNSCQPTHLSVCCNITFPTTFQLLSPKTTGSPNIGNMEYSSSIKPTDSILAPFPTTRSSLPPIMISFKPTATPNTSVTVTKSVTTLAPVNASTELETLTSEISVSKIPSVPPITESITENIITESSPVTETSGSVSSTPLLTTKDPITNLVVSSAQEMGTSDKITSSIMVNTNLIPTISSPKSNILNTETTMEHGKTLQSITKPPLPVSTSIPTETIKIPTTHQEPSNLVTITPVQTISTTYKTTLKPETSETPMPSTKFSPSTPISLPSSPPYPTFFSLPSLPPTPTLPPASSNPASTTKSPLPIPISRPDDKSLCPDPNSCSFYFKCVLGSTRKAKCIYMDISSIHSLEMHVRNRSELS